MRGDSKVREQPLCDQDQLLLFTELSDVPKSTQGFSSRFVVGCVVRTANSIAYGGGCESAQRQMLRFSNGVLKGIVSGADDDGRAETVVALPLSPALRVHLAMRWSFPITPFVHNGPFSPKQTTSPQRRQTVEVACLRARSRTGTKPMHVARP